MKVLFQFCSNSGETSTQNVPYVGQINVRWWGKIFGRTKSSRGRQKASGGAKKLQGRKKPIRKTEK